MLCHLIRQRRGNNGLHRNRILRHGSLFDASGADVIEKQNTHFVSGHKLVASVRTAHGNPDPVRVRIRRQHQIRFRVLRQLQPLLQGVKNLRIRIGTGGKITVRIFLLRHDRNIFDTDILQNTGNRNQPRAVQRGVHQLQTGCPAESRTNLVFFYGLIERFLALCSDETDQPLFDALCKRHVCSPGQNVRLLNLVVDHCGSVIRHLAAVRSVCLIPVVFGRIVGGRYHNACVAMIISGGEAKRRNRHQLVIDAYLNPVRRKNARRVPGKVPALQATVIADRHRLVSALRFNPVCHALGRLPHHPDVHPVRSCSQCAAESRCSEFKGYRKPLPDGIIVSGDISKLLFQIKVHEIRLQPSIIFVPIHD